MKTKRILLIVLAFIMAASLAACGAGRKTQAPRVMALKGPTGMGMAKLMEDNEYDITLANAPDEVSTALINGSIDIAAVPVNLASVLYNKTNGEVQMFSINTLGVLYIVENGVTVRSAEDLRGKKLYATGQGSTPEYILRYVLAANGIDPDKDIEIEYLADHSELAVLMAAGEAVLGMLPEPNVTALMMTADNEGTTLRIALDMTEEWGRINETELVQGCMVVRRAYAEANEKALLEFYTRYKASVKYVLENREGAGLIAKHGIVASENIAQSALPRCNLTVIDGEEQKTKANEFLGVLFEANPKSIGGALPGDEFYYNFK